jgi:hypothetical protein
MRQTTQIQGSLGAKFGYGRTFGNILCLWAYIIILIILCNNSNNVMFSHRHNIWPNVRPYYVNMTYYISYDSGQHDGE